ncbi:MAG: class I SAM-dependent methyltransferase [Betaproteobacteria bacterium]|nr:class I SAM-dependent methyltransferase [Betaproteobacteria bacterium]
MLRGVLAATALIVVAATAAQQYQYPNNLDVPYVPTNQPTVEAMLRIANVGPNDYVIDLGSGDGRIVITAARQFGAHGFGVDLDPQRIKESTENAMAAGVSDRAVFYQRNVFDTKLSEATVVTMYLLPRINLKLRPRLLAELKPGTRIVAHDFDMGEWKADITATVRAHNSTVYYWVVPAGVDGLWNLRVADPKGEHRYDLAIKQKFQEINVNTSAAGKAGVVREERLDGDRITFVLIDGDDYMKRLRFEGRVNGDTMEGTMRGEGSAPRTEVKWRATRAAK